MDNNKFNNNFYSNDPSNQNRKSIIEKDSVGQYLRKIRIGNRIDIAKMAEDTKINPDYITAIEKNDFDIIPGETYRKIFIKNIAKYLDIDPEEVYEKYKHEYNAKNTLSEEPSPNTEELQNDSPKDQDKNSKEEPKPSKNIIVTMVVIVSLFISLMILQNKRKQNYKKTSYKNQSTQISQLPKTKKTKSQIQKKTTEQDFQSINNENLLKRIFSLKNRQSRRFYDESSGNIKLHVYCKKDSSYVKVFRQNILWSNVFRNGNQKVFASDSTIYVKIYTPSSIIFIIKNKLFPLDTCSSPCYVQLGPDNKPKIINSDIWAQKITTE